jgi:hypothetical protein
MKPLFSPIAVVIGISFLSGLPLLSQQVSPPPAVVAPAKPAADPFFVGQDAKEKAEDAYLLQQLEGESSQDVNPKPKERWSGRISNRGGAAVGVAPVTVPFAAQNLLTRSVGSSKPLLVRTSEPEPKTQAALEQDLSVMAHILGKAINELPGGRGNMKALGIDLFFTPGSAPLHSLYLDNYGALFFLGVNFPLIAPPEKHAEEKPAGDSDWEDAREELYGQRSQAGLPGEPAEDYRQEKVDKLKEKLLEALKNATNIRGLKPDEFVTVWVSGGNNGGSRRLRVMKANPAGGMGGDIVSVDQPASLARRTMMTLRVSKAQIDAYSKGKIGLEEFQKHAQITTYTGDAVGGGADVFVGGGGYAGRNSVFRNLNIDH